MAHVLDTRHDAVLLARDRDVVAARPAHQAFTILRVGFALLPILAGLDKFMGVLVDWKLYLAPAIMNALPLDPPTLMMVVGVIEIAAGILVAMAPRIGGYVVAAWLWAIIVNLLMMGEYYDIALRDFGLSLGAIALARLAIDFAPPRRVEAA
jgi:uncharacterized membrane protein YphA (DoxX/SURF4 family)